MCQGTGPYCQRPSQSWPAISRAGDACKRLHGEQAEDKKRFILYTQAAGGCVCVRVSSENSELPTERHAELCPDSDERWLQVLGCWKRQQVGCKNGRADLQHGTLSLLCTWMLPSRSRCCSCRNINLAATTFVSGRRWPDVFDTVLDACEQKKRGIQKQQCAGSQLLFLVMPQLRGTGLF